MSSFPSQAQQTVTVLGTKYNLDVLEGLEEKGAEEQHHQPKALK